ncbi:MAG: hypothetical protein AAFU67_15705 [Bacteroidota bacterium]
MKALYLSLLFLLLLVYSCAPIRVVRVSPATEADIDRYLYGNAVQHQEAQGVAVDVSYYDASREFLVFNLEIENQTETSFDFDPAGITLLTDDDIPIRAVNPEVKLLSMDMQAAKKESNSRTMAWIGSGILVASTVALALSGSDASESLAEDVAVNVATEMGFTLADALVFQVIDGNNNNPDRVIPISGEMPPPENRFFWLDYAMRITTVRPGERVIGKVAFPRSDLAKFLKIQINVAERSFNFPFKQMVYRP